MGIAPSPPRDLVAPRPGSTTGRAVITMATRQLFDTFKALEIAPVASRSALAEYEKARAVLLGFLPGNPKAVSRLLRQPTVSTPLRHLRDGSAPVDDALVEFAGQALFELSLSGELPHPVMLERSPSRLVSVLHRRVLESGGGSIEFGVPGDSAGEATDRIRPAGLEIDVSGLHDEEWIYGRGRPALREVVEAFADDGRLALARIEEAAPALRSDIDRFLPLVGVAEEDAAARATIGLGWCAPHEDVIGLAEALVRAATRQKMHAFLELDPIARSGDARPILEASPRAAAAALHAGLESSGEASSGRRARTLREEIAALLENAPPGDDLTPAGEAVLAELFTHREGAS